MHVKRYVNLKMQKFNQNTGNEGKPNVFVDSITQQLCQNQNVQFGGLA